MHIAILAPTHRSFISKFLPQTNLQDLPEGFNGAPWIGPIIEQILNEGHIVSVISTTFVIDGNYAISTFNFENFNWIVIPMRIHSFRNNGKKLGRIVDFFLLEQNKMIEALKIVNPDLVHGFWSYEFAGAAIKSGFPYLVTVQDNAFKILQYFKNLYRFFRLLMSEKYLRKVKYASVPAPYMFNYVKSRCVNVKIIPNPVSIQLKEDEINHLIELKIKTLFSPKLIMIFNGWDERKNGKNALKAFSLLLKRIPNAQLNLFGTGTEMFGNAYIQARSINIKNINFNGMVQHDFIIENIKDSHILLHPSLEESFGVVLIEAMSFGVPTIGGDNSGAVPWVVNDENLLVDVKNPVEMANKMFELLTKVDLYRNSAISGYLNVSGRFSSSVITNSYLDYYNEILNRN
jgi:glycosyltransferase involved in cell wall biosynthesis